MSRTIEAVRAIAAHEFRTTIRGRLVPGFAVLFAASGTLLAVGGLAATGTILVQGFQRTAVSLLGISVYLLPLLGLLLGAAGLGGAGAGTELLAAQPVTRGQVLGGRIAGLVAAFLVVPLAGFAVTGLVVALGSGTAGLAGYLLVAAGATGVGLVGLGLGVLTGVATRRRGAAVGWALAVWLAFAVLYDLVAIGVVQLAGVRPGPLLLLLLAANPLDGVRSLALVLLGADVLLGPTGAALRELLGAGSGSVWILASLLVWLIAPAGLAVGLFRRRDF